MAKTIDEHFDPQSLPSWARKYPEVVELAQRNLAFRCEVYSAKTRGYQKILIRLAREVAERAEEYRLRPQSE